MLNLGQSASLKNNGNKIKKIVIKIPSDIKYVKKVSSKVLDSLASHDVNESDIFDIKLCVEEAVINAIVHGNCHDKNKSVRITSWVEDSRLNVEVEDEGSGFNRESLADPTANDNIMKGSGRGVYLINKFMDEIGYNDSGNKIKMTKNLESKK